MADGAAPSAGGIGGALSPGGTFGRAAADAGGCVEPVSVEETASGATSPPSMPGKLVGGGGGAPGGGGAREASSRSPQPPPSSLSAPMASGGAGGGSAGPSGKALAIAPSCRGTGVVVDVAADGEAALAPPEAASAPGTAAGWSPEVSATGGGGGGFPGGGMVTVVIFSISRVSVIGPPGLVSTRLGGSNGRGLNSRNFFTPSSFSRNKMRPGSAQVDHRVRSTYSWWSGCRSAISLSQVIWIGGGCGGSRVAPTAGWAPLGTLPVVGTSAGGGGGGGGTATGLTPMAGGGHLTPFPGGTIWPEVVFGSDFGSCMDC